MDDSQRTREDLLKELWELRRWKEEQEAALPKRREDLIRLRLIESAPLTMWACDRDCRIVCWNRQAEIVYGYSAEEAIGENFLELFVHEYERAQAEQDCQNIIDTGREFKNFLAYDVAKDGSQQVMLTNCFRVWDQESEEYLQAEVGLEISDFHASETKHRTLRELGAELVAERRETVKIKRAEMSNLLEATRCTVEGVLGQRMRELEEWVREIERSGSAKAAPNSTHNTRKKLTSDLEHVARGCAELRGTIEGATEMEQLEGIRVQIGALSKVIEE